VVAPLAFRCTGCGNCCRSLRVAITAQDLARLTRASGLPTTELVDWLAPDAVDMAGEPESFVELAEGRRLLVLRHRGGACRLLGTDNRCTQYEARPRDCRAFPFDFSEPPQRRLGLLPLLGCDYAEDGNNDPKELAAEDDARWQELSRYQELVARWNRRAWHRKRLHKSGGNAEDFLRYVAELSHSDL
jgi:Fe-S-cluster containining protein